jgi:putative phosphoesterase
MASYAIFSDIHGNLSAMKQMWGKINRLGLTGRTVFNAGDTVAYGQDSAACIDFIRQHEQIVSVGGNYDYNTAEYPERHTEFARKWKLKRSEKYVALHEASEHISEDQRLWLSTLPQQLILTIEDKAIALCHYSPIGRKVGLGSWTSDEDLLLIAESCPYDVIITGHTHSSFVKRVGKTLFVNPGSVGRSWGSSTFAVLTIAGDTVTGEVLI